MRGDLCWNVLGIATWDLFLMVDTNWFQNDIDGIGVGVIRREEGDIGKVGLGEKVKDGALCG